MDTVLRDPDKWVTRDCGILERARLVGGEAQSSLRKGVHTIVVDIPLVKKEAIPMERLRAHRGHHRVRTQDWRNPQAKEDIHRRRGPGWLEAVEKVKKWSLTSADGREHAPMGESKRPDRSSVSSSHRRRGPDHV